MRARPIALSGCLAVLLALIGTVPTGASGESVRIVQDATYTGCTDSRPEPGTTEPVQICWSLFRPAVATRRHQVPLIFHSHGWGGSRTTTQEAFAGWLDRGYAVLSFDQRGFGESGGKAHIMNPAIEGVDVQRLIAMVSKRRWIRKDGPRDPRMGAIGGSYGGGYQLAGAFRNLQTRGKPVFDALAPEITWWDLRQSLAPERVTRGEWALALSTVGAQALEDEVIEAVATGLATGDWPDGSIEGTTDMDAYLARNGPRWHVSQGRRLDIPVLFGQGTTDTLFPLRQGLVNWQRALTARARRDSIFVGYNGGHVLPGVFPATESATSDPCSRTLGGGSFERLSMRFFDEQLRGRDTGLGGYGRYHLATVGGGCTSVGSVVADRGYDVGTVPSTTAAGAPVSVEVVDGPIRVAGTPYLTGTMTALGLKNRAFYGLAIGTTPLDARLVQGNVLPVNEPEPVLGEDRRVALPSVAVDVPAGQSLFLLASPVSDTFVGMGSRAPGLIALDGVRVHLPVVG